MSWLKYGVDIDNSLVAIEDVPSGRRDLFCPFCRGELTAKKGRIKEHHFAHTDETCREVAKRREGQIPSLPLYDKFNLQLSTLELEQLKKLEHGWNINTLLLEKLEKKGFVQWNPYRGSWGKYEHTKLGKIPVGKLSLMLFNQVQEPLILEKLQQLEETLFEAYTQVNSQDISQILTQVCRDGIFRPTNLLTDLRIYRASYQKILRLLLYYLEVQADGQTFYKIGVTTRPIGERIAEVDSQLRSHFHSVLIKVIGTWAHRGNVEKYFKYRYAHFNYPIGNLTEYYKFDRPEDAAAVIRDLRRMKPKVFSQIERDILSGKQSYLEQMIEAQQKPQERSLLVRSHSIKVGMHRAAYWGVHIGRPSGAESEEAFLAKPSSKRVIEALDSGLSLRSCAAQSGVAVNTVRKVKAILEHKQRQ